MNAKRITTVIAATIVSASLVATSAFAGTIYKRERNQQLRIAQGVASGQLTPRETAKIERHEARLNAEIKDMREDHGGTLTKRDRVIINNQQNKLSREIYYEKHDGEKQP